MPTCSSKLRKNFLSVGCRANHLEGIAGPGAPHTFAFDRISDLGPLPFQNFVSC